MASRVVLALGLLIFTSCAIAPRYTKSRSAGAVARETLSRGDLVQVGYASFYGEEFHGRPTASGAPYDMNAMTAAHKTLPLMTRVRVTNLSNAQTVELVINDRGPFVPNRILDCSFGAATALGFVGEGTTKVRVEVIELGSDSSP